MTTSPAVLQPSTLRIEAPRGWLNVDFGELWAARELLYFFVWRDIKIRYKQTAIGAAWAVLQPLMTMLVFSLFFGKLAKIPSHGLPYPIFYYSALLPWMYFSGALQNATNVVVEQQRVITKVYFPRLVLAIVGRPVGVARFCDCLCGVSGDDALLPHHAGAGHLTLPLLSIAGGPDRARSGSLAFRLERHLPRRSLCSSLSGAILDVRFSRGLSQQPGP